MSILLPVAAWIGHVVLWVAIVSRTHAYAWPRLIVDALTVLCGLAMVLLSVPLVRFSWPGPFPTSLAWIDGGSDLLATSYATACVGVAVAAVVHGVWRSCHSERRGALLARSASRLSIRDHKPRELLAAGMPRLLGTLPGNQTLAPIIVQKELAIPNLPPGFEGLRIVHLSDLHMSGRIGRAFYDAIVDATNELEADVIALTGDIVEKDSCLDWIDQSLSRLSARQAKLFVLGNHDLKSTPGEIRARMVDHGFEDVGGRWRQFDWPGGNCLACGNEMPWFPPTPDLSNSPLERAESDLFRLALIHTPDLFCWAQQNRFQLVLAGHNHGGQIRLPGLGAIVAPSKFGTRYASGVFATGQTVMHVSQGTSSLAPVRWNCPPELALLTLRAQ
ncbi:MAG: metallophosphoesterase [Aeoliella sp.]